MQPTVEEKKEITAYAKDMRRQLHRIPELSDREYETSKFLTLELEAMGYSPEHIHTGLYVDIAGTKDGGKIALRCDMDALPITEKNDVDFKAKENMHACGHDGHMAIVLAAAKLLKKYPPDFDVRLIFQFGEEGEGGADKMIRAGVLSGVNEIFAFHLCPELDKGRIASCTGAMFAGAVEFDVICAGKSAHCADRTKGSDAVAVVRELLFAARTLDEKYDSVVLHVGKIDAGNARNIVADSAKADCTLRYFDTALSEFVMKSLAETLAAADMKYGTHSRIEVKTVYPPLVNSPRALERLRSVAEIEICEPRFTAEDFAFYTKKIDGCMAWLGVRDENHSSPLHSDTFGFDESALGLGIETMFKLCFENDKRY